MPTPMPTPTPNLLVLVQYGSSALRDAMDELANAVSTHLHIPVKLAYLEAAAPSVGEAIQAGIAEHAPRHVIVLPLFLGASAARINNVQQIVAAAEERWSQVAVEYGKPLGTHPGVIAAYSQLVANTLQANPSFAASDTALLVVGRGSRDAASNAEVYQMARLLWETCQFKSAEAAFYGTTKPDIAEGLRRCVQSGARQVIVLPYVLYDRHLARAIQAQAAQFADIASAVIAELDIHDGILEAIRERYHETLAELTTQLASNTRPIRTHSHGAGGTHAHAIARVDSALLPPRYQGNAEVSAAPMGAADLIFDADGNVAWDEIWGDFCDLALAGGPPHRGTLLEPVAPEHIAANPAAYQRVLHELARGIRLITGLPVLPHLYAGWIGIQCTDEAMALWLLRAIVVENVSVRREDTVLFLPAAPDFRLEYEIKNVITVVAKTHHYWTEHITNQPEK
jgi:sirohydrochlorin cobaltochelatase